MPNLLARFVRDETGAAALEYCLIAAGTGLAVFAAVKLIGPGVKDSFNNLAPSVPNVREIMKCRSTVNFEKPC